MNDLDLHFNRLAEVIATLGLPTWNEVLFTDNLELDPGSLKSAKAHDFCNAHDFAPLFETYLNEGHSWLNLNCMGVLGSTLIVSLEKPTSTAVGSITSVNLSGPPNFVKNNGFDLRKFIEITV